MGVPKNIDYSQCIYGLKSTDGRIRYIGHARYAAERLALHKQRAKGGRYNHLPVYEWMHSEGLDNIKVEILAKFHGDWNMEQVCEQEIQYIRMFKDVWDLTNTTEGGYIPHLPSMLRGEKHPLFGTKLDEDRKKAMQEGRKAVWESLTDEEKDERRQKMSESQIEAWKKRPEEDKIVVRERGAKALKAYSSTGTKEEIHFKMSYGPHVRYHIKGEKPNPECQHCINEKLA